MKKTKLFLLLGLCLGFFISEAQVRQELLLEKDWKFTREDPADAQAPDFCDKKWETVRIPHDWAIYGPFSSRNDVQNVAIAQDGQKEALEHAGRTGGLPFVGTGWYRRHFRLPAGHGDGRVTLVFDGAMSHATVYVNGRKAGYWPYGYNSFHMDITGLVDPEGDNVLAVRLENQAESSRWYPGAGLYRNVRLVLTGKAHIPVWGTQVLTPVVNPRFAVIRLRTELCPDPEAGREAYRLVTEIRNPEGKVVARSEDGLALPEGETFEQQFTVTAPGLWSPESPQLYAAESRLYAGSRLLDEYRTTFGIRSIEVIPDKGFFLNGRRIIFKGVCLHHDLGPLGAAVNRAAVRRQVRILKDMGCNAIRTSHNMPAPELVEACDEAGIMLMAESFDEWKLPKCRNGYNLLFDDWAEKDLTNLIRHYRNHPSIMMWCIGNEVSEQPVPGAVKRARFLQDICHREDPSRPVTQGMDNPGAVVNNNFAAIMDIAGFNYRPWAYPEAYARLPQQLVLGSETASTLSSRGVYKFPVIRRSMARYPDHQSSSYDVEHCAWSNLPEDDFIQHEDYPWCMGEFVWTGFDYLGEPTPYYSDWPSHSSLFGIVDLAGIPKDRYYLYRSHWNRKEETLHILPHWTWPDRTDSITPVFVYTSYPSAELFINGRSQGRRSKDLSVKVDGSGSREAQQDFTRQKRYRLMWMDCRYEPGSLKVVAYDEDGRPAATREVHTAGVPCRLVLEADRTVLDADGRDLSFIRVKLVDKDGNLCPQAGNLIRFKVRGAGTFRASANGDPTCTHLFHRPEMPLFNGQLTAIVQAGEEAGKIVFEARSAGLQGAALELQAGKGGRP